jgi:hypothetical protein
MQQEQPVKGAGGEECDLIAQGGDGKMTNSNSLCDSHIRFDCPSRDNIEDSILPLKSMLRGTGRHSEGDDV